MQLIHQLSDAELIHDFLQGRESALETLIVRYKDKIYTSIYMLVKDKYIAEDIFQDAFLKMINTMRQGRYSEQGKFLPWAMRVAHNLCMDHFRKVKHQVQITLPRWYGYLRPVRQPRRYPARPYRTATGERQRAEAHRTATRRAARGNSAAHVWRYEL